MRSSLIIFLIAFLVGCQSKPAELHWTQENGYRWADVELDYFGSTGFKKLSSSQTGVSFKVNLTQEEILENQMLLHGSGVATADVDSDGLVDVYLAQLNGSNKLFRNTGNFQFEDITEQAGVSHEGHYSTGVLFADIDGDDDPDLLINTMEGTIGVYLNDGSGTFTQVENSGLGGGNGGSTLTMGDIDSDGDLDLFIANNKKKRVYDIFSREELQSGNIIEKAGQNSSSGETKYNLKEPFDRYFEIINRKGQSPQLGEIGEENRLFLNEGKGKFREVTNEEGRFMDTEGNPVVLKPEWSLTALFQDINGDRLPDLYVCNDYFGPNRVWINQGNGRFREIDELAIRNFSYSSMGVAMSDINKDGYLDLFVTEMLSQVHQRRAKQQVSTEIKTSKIREIEYQPQYMRNSLYLSRSDNTFTEIPYFSGVEASEWSWATRFFDVDLDGHEDIIINTGFAYDSIDMDYFENRNRDKGVVNLDEAPELNLVNKIFKNNGDLTFTENSEEWGFSERDVSYGLATADFDNDGDLDLVKSRFKSEAAIYENSTNKPRIAVRLRGNQPNTAGIGAEIKLTGGPAPQSRQLVSGGDYLSGSAPYVVFAATAESKTHEITVTWPNGNRTYIDSVAANRIYEIGESVTSLKAGTNQTNESDKTTIFEEVSDRINHQHHEALFNDFSIQPLLPIRLSRLGPGISWIDFDTDQDDDLFITSGREGSLSVYENRGNGSFSPLTLEEVTRQSSSNQTTVLGWPEGDKFKLLVGKANYETDNLKAPSALSFSVEGETVSELQNIPGEFSTTGPMAAADYDADGDLDLFVGGRFVPAHYPMDATSRLFKNKSGQFIHDVDNATSLNSIGLITSAVFSDFDSDGDPDLILSREWDSILLFQNKNGVFTDVSSQYGLDEFNGWWSGITTGDFNNDGRPDIVATNLGLNSPYQLDSGFPLILFYNDFNRDGRADIVDSYFDPVSSAYVPRRQMQAYQPIASTMLSEVGSNQEFANATLQELLQTNLQNIPSKQIHTLRHTLFINRGDRFEARPLPRETQYSTAFYAGVSDFDNDGNEDLFLSQNFFEFPAEFPRLDSGRGVWLKGQGDGSFETVPARVSGIKVYGQQRGAALSDFNNDGKTDLAVSQNDTTTKLYINQTKKQGISIRLVGPDNNKTGIGSSIRLVYEDGAKGPVREIQAGSGYWSQNSTVQVMGYKREPKFIEIVWFDGTQQTVEFVSGKFDYDILYPAG